MKFQLPQFAQKIDWRDWKTYTVLPFVLFVYALYKPVEALRTKIWNDSDWEGGILHEILAIAAGIGAGVQATATFDSLWKGIGIGCLTWWYILPVLWIVLLKPAYKGVKWCWEHLDWVDKNVVGPLLKLPTRLFSWLPFAARGWANMKDNWFVTLVKGIAFVAAVIASLRLGWLTMLWVQSVVHVGGFITHEFITGAGYAAGLLVAGGVGRLLLGAIQEGDKQGVGAVVAAATTYASLGLLAKLASLIGVWIVAPAAVSYGLIAITFILLANYGFPTIYVLFASGFWKKAWDKAEPHISHYLQGEATPFRHICLQSIGIVVSLGIAVASLVLCVTLGFNPLHAAPTLAYAGSLLVSVLVPVLTFLVAYTFSQELVDDDHGNVLVDIVASLAVALGAGALYVHLGFVFGVWGAIIPGIIAAIVSFLTIPLVNCGFEWLATRPRVDKLTTRLGNALPAFHKSYIDNVAEPTFRSCERVYNWGYGHYVDDTKDAKKQAEKEVRYAAFRKLALHGVNGLVAVTLAVSTIIGLHHLAFLHGVEPWAGYLAAAIVALFSVGLFGRVLFYAGLELPGIIAAVLTGLKVGALVLPAQTLGVYFAVPFAVVVACLTYGLGFPIVLIVTRAMVSGAASSLNGWLDPINDWAWRRVRAFAKLFADLFEILWDLLEPCWTWVGKKLGQLFNWMAPFWLFIGGLIASALATCREMWKSIFG